MRVGVGMGALLMKLKMPQNSVCRSRLIKTQNVINYVHISAWQKSLHHLSLLLLDAFSFCFFSIFYDFLFVKQLSKAFTKFHYKNVCVMSARCIL